MRHRVFVFFALMSIRCAISSDELDVRAFPKQNPRGIVPELRVRELQDAGVRKLALQITLAGESDFMIYNPFGFEANGRCYQINLVNPSGQSVSTLVAKTAVPSYTTPDQWVHVNRRGMIGRCFWAASERKNDMVSLPAVPEGDYFFCLIVSKRLLHLPARPEDSSSLLERWRIEWSSAELDKPCCASQLVPVRVDKMGTYHLTSQETENRFRPLEIQPSVSETGVIRSRFWVVFDHAMDLSVFRCNLGADSKGPDHWSVVRTDGAPFEILARHLSGKGYFRNVTDRIRVPQWGIIGGTRSGIAVPDLPGQYEITAEIDESLYWDRVYDPATNARRQPPQKEWPSVFRSEPRVVDVPAIPKSQ